MLKSLIRSIAVALAIGTSITTAAEKPFDLAAYNASCAEGKPVLISIHAEWCPTCKQQEQAIGSILKQPKFQSVVAYKVDYDSDKQVVRSFSVSRQSTIIVFKGKQEVGRVLGETRADKLEALIAKAL
jgi:thioredoxin 1